MNFIKFDFLPKGLKIGPIEIAFYALFILTGAIIAYVLAAFRFKHDGYKFDVIENLFYLAFPAGIIGARIWYVIAEWNKEFGFNNFLEVFKIWNGGLAIQGGVLLGVFAGVLFIKKFRKEIPLLYAVDNCVPGILIAQALGRWGNFFNQEVYGAFVSREGWSFLPNFINDQMMVTSAGAGNVAVPLFLVESILNIAGFFILAYGIKAVLGKHYKRGDVGYGYFIWYGFVRVVMEPMRNGKYIMGEAVKASSVMAWLFIICGVLLIIFNHFVLPRLVEIKEKKNV